jgi:glycosyltransferase involved in cell wall biosynthesis
LSYSGLHEWFVIMHPMRILMVSALEVWALSGQGGAPSLFKTLEGLSRRSHEVDFVTSRIGANHHHGAPIQQPPEIRGVRFHLFQLPSLGEVRIKLPSPALYADQKLRFAALFPLLAGRLAKKLDGQQRFDLLYGYEVHGVLALRQVPRRERPFVTRFQGTVMHPYLENRLGLARRYEEVLALKTPADLMIMTDDGTQGDEVLQRLNPGSSGRVRFWRNGLDLDRTRAPSAEEAAAARTSLGLTNDELVLVTAVRLARWKRVDRAIDAVAALKARGVNSRLLIVGDGEERANLEQQARSLDVTDRVIFAGGVPQEEVQRYLWAADVFLSLNDLSNVGNPLLEAMRSGRCVVTLDEGDTRDLIRNDETGVLLPSGDPRPLAEALASLAAEPARRARLGEAARQFAAANFWSWQQRIDAEVDELEKLVAARRQETAHV